MFDQRQRKQRFLSALSSQFRALRKHPQPPNNAVQSAVAIPSIRGLSGAPIGPEPLSGSSGLVETVNKSSNQRLDQNTPNPQRPTAMISEVEQLYISGGNFIQNINNRDDNILRHVAQSLPRSCDAAFSAAINIDNLARRPCTDGTRVEIIEQIMQWTNEKHPANAPPVYWLTGLAGLGKTTIAYTICNLLGEAHRPFASFFCSLQLDSRNSKLLVTTLCRDLAELYSSYAANLLSALETNSKAANAGLRIQIDELLAKPWQVSTAQRIDLGITPIVVVDALDESDHGIEFLEELLPVIRTGELTGIKFLVTSRPDPRIVDICKTFPPNAVCKLHEIDADNVQNDIEKYLWEALPQLKDEPELGLLSQRAGGFFIYAVTAVRFICPPHNPPAVSEMRSHLRTLLNADLLNSRGDRDERLLVDELYERILGDAFRDSRVRGSRLRILHTIICAKSGIDVSVLANLTDTDVDVVEKVVESLHAVLFVSPKDGGVYWYHTSFPEFIFSQTRARFSPPPFRNYSTHQDKVIDVFCDESAYHGVLARRCFCILQASLRFNMCTLPSSYIFDSEVPGLTGSIENAFTPTFRYVSRYWARHLLQAMAATNETDVLFRDLKDFMYDKLLFWIEAMNLIGAKFECASILKEAESWVEKSKEWPDLLGYLTDATKFSIFFAGSAASKSTPHLYISALAVWNQDSPIWKFWRDRFRFIPSISVAAGTITIPLLTIHLNGTVSCVAFSPNGNQVVSSGSDTSVWDTETGEQLWKLPGHTSWVASVVFSPDGNHVVSGSFNGSVLVWDAETGEQLRKLQGHTDSVNSVAFSPHGNLLVSGSSDRSVRVWDADTGEQLWKLQGHTGWVTSVAFSPDGNQIVSGSFDESVRVWNAKTGEQLRKLQGRTYLVNSVAFSPDGNKIVSGSDKFLLVWDAKTGGQLRKLQGHTDSVNSVKFLPDGNRIVSGSEDKSVRVWGAETGKQLKELQGHTGRVTSVAISPDGNRIVSGSSDTSVRVWDGKIGEELREPEGHTGPVHSVTFSSDGNQIVSVSVDKSIGVWDAKTGKQLRKLQGRTEFVDSVAFSPNGNQIVSGSDKFLLVWDANTGEQLRKLQGHTCSVILVTFSPDGKRIVSGSYDDSVRVWDAETGEHLWKLQGPTGWVTSAAFSPNGSRIVCGSDKFLLVWDAKTGEQLRKLQGHTKLVNSVAFSPDGNRIVSGSHDDSVRVWDAETGDQLTELRGHNRRVVSVAFSPDGNRIVSGSFDQSVRVWDLETGAQLRKLQGHTDWVYSVAFSPDGNRIVSGSSDNSVRVWDNLKDDAPWVVNEDGWILSDAEMLVWVPSTIRDVLVCPHNTLILSRNGSATVSFTQTKSGTLWHECYTP